MSESEEKQETIHVTISPALAGLVPGYLENRREDLGRILTSLGSNDFETIRSIGHSMKGSGSSYGFSTLSRFGEKIELAAKEKSPSKLKNLAERLQFYLDHVVWTTDSAGVAEIPRLDPNAFKEHLARVRQLDPEAAEVLMNSNPLDLYFAAANVGIRPAELARAVADHLSLPYLSPLKPESLVPNLLPAPFCRQNLIVPVLNETGETVLALSNPFNWEMLYTIKKNPALGTRLNFLITEPENILNLLNADQERPEREPTLNIKPLGDKAIHVPDPAILAAQIESEIERHPIIYVTNNIIASAVQAKASDLHLDPKERETVVRFRIDGDLHKMFSLKRSTGTMLISRFKALGGLDIAERMKPQDGAVEVKVGDRTYKLRLATSSTPHGESLTVRMLDPSVRPSELKDLGMTPRQAETLMGLVHRGQGFVLIVGTTGSGKTTTIYSLLSKIDCRTRSLITVEDPVEYQIPDANQQQINEKAGVTFEALLKASVRQDPDVLFIGEVRDPFSANIALDFASTGHLTISTMHTSNVTTAIFRLERLGVNRLAMADAVRGISAQRLLKRLCAHCRRVEPITEAEYRMLQPYTDDIPEEVARPVGCPKCGNKGYKGRRGLYEIMLFDPQISQMIREGKPIAEIRHFMWSRGDYLISQHAMDGVREFDFTPSDIYENVLLEESRFKDIGLSRQPVPSKEAPSGEKEYRILLVEDDTDTRTLVSEILRRERYQVSAVADGVDALIHLGKQSFDLIISDINMPNLDGFKLLEFINQKGFQVPLIFLTAYVEQEIEIKGLELGATDYIRKPFKEDLLALRVRKILKERA